MSFLIRRADNVHYNASPNYSYIFSFEENFDQVWSQGWMMRNWSLSIVLAAVYLLVVFAGPKLMSNRQPVNVKPALIVWNFSLSFFSALGAARLSPGFFYLLTQHGFHYSVCDNTTFYTNKISGFWLWLFIMSKAPELADTLFIILRKQKLVLLHWFHHAATLVFTWFIYQEHAAIGRWFAVLNLLVHSVMYGYFGLRTIGVKIPRVIAVGITTSQIVQMILGTTVSVYAYAMYLKEVPCAISKDTGRSACLIYAIHLVLFVKLFQQAYLSKRTAKSPLKRE